jgi:hypothetical protein
MKNILFILGLTCFVNCSASLKSSKNIVQNDTNEKVITQIEEYVKDSLSKKYVDFKSLSTLVISDTIKIGYLLEEDKLAINTIIEKEENSMYALVFQSEMIKQSVAMRKKLKINTIDKEIVKMYQKEKLDTKKMLKIKKESANFSKSLNGDKNMKNLIHVFEYKNSKNNKIETDSAIFYYTPEKVRLFSTATKFEKGITFNGTIKTIKNYANEIMSRLEQEGQ